MQRSGKTPSGESWLRCDMCPVSHGATRKCFFTRIPVYVRLRGFNVSRVRSS